MRPNSLHTALNPSLTPTPITRSEWHRSARTCKRNDATLLATLALRHDANLSDLYGDHFENPYRLSEWAVEWGLNLLGLFARLADAREAREKEVVLTAASLHFGLHPVRSCRTCGESRPHTRTDSGFFQCDCCGTTWRTA